MGLAGQARRRSKGGLTGSGAGRGGAEQAVEGMRAGGELGRQLAKASLRVLHRVVDGYVEAQDYSSAELLYALVLSVPHIPPGPNSASVLFWTLFSLYFPFFKFRLLVLYILKVSIRS